MVKSPFDFKPWLIMDQYFTDMLYSTCSRILLVKSYHSLILYIQLCIYFHMMYLSTFIVLELTPANGRLFKSL